MWCPLKPKIIPNFFVVVLGFAKVAKVRSLWSCAWWGKAG